jgi:hypothetical protein
MGKKRKAGALALLSGYASGSDGGGSGSEDGGASSSSSSSEHSEDAPVLGPAGAPPLSARRVRTQPAHNHAPLMRASVWRVPVCVWQRMCVFCTGPPPRDAAAEEEGPSVGPSWRPADGEYEELPEAPPEEEEDEEAAAGGAHAGAPHEGEHERDAQPRRARFVSVPASLCHAPPLPPPSGEAVRPELQARAAAPVRTRSFSSAQP